MYVFCLLASINRGPYLCIPQSPRYVSLCCGYRKMNILRTSVSILLLVIVASESRPVLKFDDEDEGKKLSPPGAGTYYFDIN
jgi:hypothetical protein